MRSCNREEYENTESLRKSSNVKIKLDGLLWVLNDDFLAV